MSTFFLRKKSSFFSENDSSRNYEASRLTFNLFNLSTVLEKGALLIGSEGTEFDCLEETNANDDSNSERDRLLRQRMLLNEKLGLTQSSSGFGLNINDLVTLDDMRNNVKKYEPNKTLLPVQEILNLEVNSIYDANGGEASASLSRREMNRARRKARQQQTTTTSSGNTSTTNSNNSIDSNSGTLSRCNSTSNGSFNDDQPKSKKSKLETEISFNSSGKYFFFLNKS